MHYNRYIRDSIRVSEIGLGTWQLGNNSGWQSISEKDALKLVSKSIAYGINFFDTSPNYGYGTVEERLGKALKGVDRSKIVINTKFGHTHANKSNYNSNYIRESLEGSLKRLQTDYVDSYIFHNPPIAYLDGNKNDHYEILERLIEEGKIKAYGASLDSFDEIKLFMDTTNAQVIEVFFNILHQDTSRAFDMAKEKEVSIIAKIPLDSGWLTGKYNHESTFDGIRSRWSRQDIQTRANLVKKVKDILESENNLAQKAISFCLAYDAISTVIPGSVNVENLRGNIESADNPMSLELVKKLENFYHDEVKDLNLPW